MSITILLTDGAVLPEEMIRMVDATIASTRVTRVATGQAACPFCGDATHLRGTADAGRLECWRCWHDCWLLSAQGGIYMTRSHDWRGHAPAT